MRMPRIAFFNMLSPTINFTAKNMLDIHVLDIKIPSAGLIQLRGFFADFICKITSPFPSNCAFL